VVPGDAEWPVQLDDLATAAPLQRRGGMPLGLWVRGPVRLDEIAGSVAVVGSRSATTYGADVASEIAAAVGEAGRCVVSGAAFGIDQAGHRGALAGGGRTVAVLACGADRAYPAAHRQLIDHVAAHGAVVSEALPGWAPTRLRFLARNRLIAALTVGTVVVEAAVRSGALNTANWATRLNRHLLGVPGPVTSGPSQGVHQLIRSGAATLVTSGADVLEAVGASGEHLQAEPRGPSRARDRLTVRQQQVLDAVPAVQPAPDASIARTAGLGLADVRGALATLCDLGMVRQEPAGWRLAALAHE
jgi:DNA processing protein